MGGEKCVTPPEAMLAVKFATSFGILMNFPYRQCFDFQGVGLGKILLYAQEFGERAFDAFQRY